MNPLDLMSSNDRATCRAAESIATYLAQIEEPHRVTIEADDDRLTAIVTAPLPGDPDGWRHAVVARLSADDESVGRPAEIIVTTAGGVSSRLLPEIVAELVDRYRDELDGFCTGYDRSEDGLRLHAADADPCPIHEGAR